MTDVSDHPENQVLSAYLSGHGSTATPLSRRATPARPPGVLDYEHPRPYACRTLSASGRGQPDATAAVAITEHD